MILLGAAGQFGIFGVLLLALLLGFTWAEAASSGAIDGPTSIYVSGILAPHLLGPITVAAYRYMDAGAGDPAADHARPHDPGGAPHPDGLRRPAGQPPDPVGERFLQPGTLAILGLGIVAFALDTATGVLFAKGLSRLSGGTFNPLIGAAGISAFPMAARVVQRVAQEEDFENFPLMHAMGANAAGQVASVVAGGVLLALVAAA